MTWTYTGDPSKNDRDAVRFLGGLTVPSDQLVQDEEIAFSLAREGGIDLAAALVCDHLAARFSREADTKVGEAQESCSQRAEAFRKIATDLRTKSGARAQPVLGVQTVSGKRALDNDTGALQPNFRIGLNDNPLGPANPTVSGSDLTRDL